jgi:hypothetical protein
MGQSGATRLSHPAPRPARSVALELVIFPRPILTSKPTTFRPPSLLRPWCPDGPTRQRPSVDKTSCRRLTGAMPGRTGAHLVMIECVFALRGP